jgi:hypothetical protein
MILNLTEGDTKPTPCSYAADLTGATITVNIGYPTPLVKAAQITNALGGLFQIPWVDGDLQAGTWTANFTITDASGAQQTTDPFQIHVDRRIA